MLEWSPSEDDPALHLADAAGHRFRLRKMPTGRWLVSVRPIGALSVRSAQPGDMFAISNPIALRPEAEKLAQDWLAKLLSA